MWLHTSLDATLVTYRVTAHQLDLMVFRSHLVMVSIIEKQKEATMLLNHQEG
nr:hypothetical protein [Pseudoalteromonas sp. A601]